LKVIPNKIKSIAPNAATEHQNKVGCSRRSELIPLWLSKRPTFREWINNTVNSPVRINKKKKAAVGDMIILELKAFLIGNNLIIGA
jgi:hypothetical protein